MKSIQQVKEKYEKESSICTSFFRVTIPFIQRGGLFMDTFHMITFLFYTASLSIFCYQLFATKSFAGSQVLP